MLAFHFFLKKERKNKWIYIVYSTSEEKKTDYFFFVVVLHLFLANIGEALYITCAGIADPSYFSVCLKILLNLYKKEKGEGRGVLNKFLSISVV